MSEERVIFELTLPGSWPDLPNGNESGEMKTLLESAITSFYEANTALWLFDIAFKARWDSIRPEGRAERWEAESVRLREIENELRQESEDAGPVEIYDRARLQLKREQWASGKLPEEFEAAFPRMHAHSFLFALDAVGKILNVLAKNSRLTTKVRDAAKRFDAELPQIRQVRDSAHHKEDRIRRQGPNKRPIPSQPVDGYGIFIPGGNAVITVMLSDRTLAYTVADGHLVGVDITVDTLFAVQNILQEVLNAFGWTGNSQHYPS